MTASSRKLVSAVATIMVAAAAAALLGLGILIAAGYKPQVVKSGSMRPMLERGSLVFVKPTPATQLVVGDVITFQNPIKGGKELVTHRIVAIKQDRHGRVFVTKGDANADRDPWLAQLHRDAGVLKFEIPVVGELSFIVHSRNGYIALFALPLFLLAFVALWRIWQAPPKQPRPEPDPLAVYRLPAEEGSGA